MMETEAVVAQGTLKVTCPRDELARALGIVSRGVSTRSSVQILSGILLRAEGGKLELAATDMELSLRTSLEGTVEGEGSVVVPGRLLLRALLAAGRRRQPHARAARLAEADRDRLLRGARAVFALAAVVDLLPDEFAGLGARRLPFPTVFLRAFERFLLGHASSFWSAHLRRSRESGCKCRANVAARVADFFCSNSTASLRA